VPGKEEDETVTLSAFSQSPLRREIQRNDVIIRG